MNQIAFHIFVFIPYRGKRIISVGHAKMEETHIFYFILLEQHQQQIFLKFHLRLDLQKCSKSCLHHAGLKDSFTGL